MNNPNATYYQGGPLLLPPVTLPSQQQQQDHNISAITRQQTQQSYHPSQYATGTPHQPQNLSTVQSQFLPSQPSNQHSLVQHQSHHAATPPTLIHQPSDPGLFNPHPSPYSTNSAPGSYVASDAQELMAQATMSRQAYPPSTSLQTPQSQSPASIHSPHHDVAGRTMYGYPSMAQSMYYTQSYQMHPAVAYAPQQSTTHTFPSVSSAGMVLHHPQQIYMPQSQLQSQPQQSMIEPPKPQHPPLQRTPNTMPQPLPPPQAQQQQQQQVMPHPQQQVMPHPQQQATPQTPSAPTMQTSTLQSSTQANTSASTSSAAPGPIPATTPLVVRQDQNGVQWIMFEYSRDRIKMEYTIRCDVESVKVDELSQEFKSANCVYPRACGPKDTYKGNRLAYEGQCNTVGWALASLNPALREKRGLIQRAVDSWRNSNHDPRLRSRRVRRQAKMSTRKLNNQQAMTLGMTGSTSLSSHVQSPQQLQQARPTGSASQHMIHLHHHGSSQSAGILDASDDRYNVSSPQQQMQSSKGMTSPASFRYAQQFQPQYAQQAVAGSSRIPSIQGGMTMSLPSSTAKAATIREDDEDDEETSKRALFGDLQSVKRRKFLLIEDPQRTGRVRVKIALDQVKMDDMPDAHLRVNSVFPRSYYPRQMRSPTGSPKSRRIWEDDDAMVRDDRRGKTFVPVRMIDGSEQELPIPKLTHARRGQEVALNELGYRMSWSQARTFNGRTLFLQRSLDAYRAKIKQTVSDEETERLPAHFELRAGKRKLLQHEKRERRDSHAS